MIQALGGAAVLGILGTWLAITSRNDYSSGFWFVVSIVLLFALLFLLGALWAAANLVRRRRTS